MQHDHVRFGSHLNLPILSGIISYASLYTIILFTQHTIHSNKTDWVRIATDIEANYQFYDAFIILHGTDTMAYTASALSFMLEELG